MRLALVMLLAVTLAGCETTPNPLPMRYAPGPVYQDMGGAQNARDIHALDQRLRQLEYRDQAAAQDLSALLARICRLEGKLDQVSFGFPANGGVVVTRGREPPRQC